MKFSLENNTPQDNNVQAQSPLKIWREDSIDSPPFFFYVREKSPSNLKYWRCEDDDILGVLCAEHFELRYFFASVVNNHANARTFSIFFVSVDTAH